MFAQRIKKLRLKNDLTQKDLSDFLVVTPKTVSFYELGQRMPPANVLMKLCQKFNVSVDYLLGLTDIPYTIDDYIAKQKKTGTQPAADEYSADERKIIDMYRQLSEKDKGKIEGRLEEMLDDEQATTKGA
ncbi:helix-turn-helix domain-containing protein [Megamonas hypermegale]|uniref:helix-turn-helix domain-containing protein n=1 Tax=Megamonas hypermegale TaxID=158847 RepID=UPI00195A8FAE|nr:helix-turn-helix transcriptional regulator [Megamonas hypermegale]MBM6833875.1 helix-turn-helix transcriptional regulator [Megamonas hypermegale]